MNWRFLRVTMLAALPLLGVRGAEPATATPAPPDRREIWVPTDRLNEILKKNPKAVLISREQYETLLRDSHAMAKSAPVLPRELAFASADYHARIDGRVLRVQAELSVQVLSEGWTQLPLVLGGLSLASLQVDGDAALAPPGAAAPANGEPAPARLFLRGRGAHKITAEFTAPISVEAGVSRVELRLPPAGSGAFQAELPAHTRVEASQPARVETLPQMTRLTAAIAPDSPTLVFAWHVAADPANSLPARAELSIGYLIDGDKLRTECSVIVSTPLGTLPAQLQITVPQDCTVLEVTGEDVASWSAEGGRIKIGLQTGEHGKAAFHFALQQPSLGGAAQATRDLPMPKLDGAGEVFGRIALNADPGVEIKELTMDPSARTVAPNPGAVGAWEFTNALPAGRVAIERLAPRFSVDLDTVADFKLDAVYLERTITLHEDRGQMFHLQAAVPPGEEVLGVRTGDHEADWRIEGGQLLLRWSDAAAPGKPRAFILRTRTEPRTWTQPPPEGITFTLADLRIEGAENISGYIALRADESFRLEAQPSDTLERRDARTTPVHGEYAWFRRDAFALQVKVMRRPGEVLATLTGYALPLEGMLDLHARIDWEFKHSGVRSVRVRVPAALAAQFHFDGPQIAERSLIDNTWRITFQKELTGSYGMDVTAQLPIARDANDPARFKVQVPVVEPLGAQRTGGVWSVEANTETEITIDSKGMNELDALAAPPLPGYTPRHRVIGVFGWIGGTYTLALSGVRHATARVLTTVVDAMAVDSVLSTSGAIRTQAVLTLRTAGSQFLNLTLPSGARLLSLTVDDLPLKPVEGAPDEVRVELPAKGDPSAATRIVVLYETSAGEWGAGGKIEVPAPRLPAEVPVLRSTWHVYLPDGFRYADFQSNLPTPEELPERLLVQRPAELASLWRLWSAFAVAGSSGISEPRPLSELFGYAQGEPKSEVAYREKEALSKEEMPAASAPVPTAALAAPAELQSALEMRSQPGMIRPTDVTAALAPPGGAPAAGIEAKLNRIIIPKLEFREATVEDALRFIEKRSAELDTAEANPARRGVKIHSNLGQPGSAHITVSLTNIPLGEAIRYVTSLANLTMKAQPDGVSVVPLSMAMDGLQTVEITAPPGFLTPPQTNFNGSPGSGGRATRINAEEILTAEGMTFPAGAEAVYLPSSNKLIVKNTQENLDLLTAVARAAGAAAPSAAAPRTPHLLDGDMSLAPSDSLATKEFAVPGDFLSHLGKNGNGNPGHLARIDVKDTLAASGIIFPSGASAEYLPGLGRLVVKNTIENLDLIMQVIMPMVMASNASFGDARSGGAKGLLPIKLELPKVGREVILEGLIAPDHVTFRYDDWWGRARRLWWCLLGGGLAFFLVGQRRPWWKALWAILLLSAIPLCVSPELAAACNALLAGWLLALVLARLAARRAFARHAREEALAS